MLKVYIVRHGETDWNVQGRLQGWTDTPLNARGLEQAGLIARRLAEEERFAAIYSSPLQRAFKTAEIIGRAVRVVPEQDERLKERCLGAVEGLTFSEIEGRFPELYREWRSSKKRVPFPDEESPVIFHKRLSELIRDVKARHPDGRVMLVTHGGALGMLMATVMQLDLERHFPFWFDNACINIVEFGARVPRVLALNDTCHLRNARPNPASEREADVSMNDGRGELPRPAVI